MLDQATSIDHILRQIRLELHQLPYLGTMLADEPVEVQDIWHWRWESHLESIERLCRQYRDGLMSEAQEREFLAVTTLLTENRSRIEALGCRIPPGIDQPANPGGSTSGSTSLDVPPIVDSQIENAEPSASPGAG